MSAQQIYSVYRYIILNPRQKVFLLYIFSIETHLRIMQILHFHSQLTILRYLITEFKLPGSTIFFSISCCYFDKIYFNVGPSLWYGS